MPEEHIIVIEPIRKNHAENVELIKREMFYRGVSVIIERRECIQTAVVSIAAIILYLYAARRLANPEEIIQ